MICCASGICQLWAKASVQLMLDSSLCRNNEVKCTHLIRDCFVENVEKEANFARCWLDKCFKGPSMSPPIPYPYPYPYTSGLTVSIIVMFFVRRF